MFKMTVIIDGTLYPVDERTCGSIECDALRPCPCGWHCEYGGDRDCLHPEEKLEKEYEGM